jgi:hypothetical protein
MARDSLLGTQSNFLSYARADSEFALKLANSLRIAHANIWIDQLDIPPGNRWDVAIEKALENANNLIVILSKSAISSNNVMDEVSYALEVDKTILPVLFEECNVPFRLRRLQFIDFTADYEKGLAKLLTALGIDGGELPKLPNTALGIDRPESPKLPDIKADIEAVGNFFRDKLLRRTAALLSLVLLVRAWDYGVDKTVRKLFDVEPSPMWLWYGLLIGGPAAVVLCQLVIEWQAGRDSGRRRRGDWWRQATAYLAPALLVLTLATTTGVVAWYRFEPSRVREQLRELGLGSITEAGGLTIKPNFHLTDDTLAKAAPLFGKIAGYIRAVDLSETQITHIRPLSPLTGLQTLNLLGTQVADIEPLRTLTGLQTLDLSFTRVADIEPLRTLAELQTLNLLGTQVADIEPLKALTGLQALDLSFTPVADIEPLKALTGLQKLDLMGTRVADIKELRKALSKTNILWDGPSK